MREKVAFVRITMPHYGVKEWSDAFLQAHRGTLPDPAPSVGRAMRRSEPTYVFCNSRPVKI
jgi:hypothetical protein